MSITQIRGTSQIQGNSVSSAELTATGIVPDMYGDSTHVAQITLDEAGRVVVVDNVLIEGSEPGGDAGGDLDGTYPDPEVIAASGAFAFKGTITPSQITSNQNNYNPTGLENAVVLRLTTDTDRNITGLDGGTEGRVIIIMNVNTLFNRVVLVDNSGSSDAENRFDFDVNGNVSIDKDQAVLLWYDLTAQRWKLIGGAGGAGLPPDGNYNDIDISMSGTVWTIVNNAVTLAKFQQIATDSILGRATASTGNVEVLTALPFAFTGDVTRPADSNAQTIANDAVTTTKILNDNVTYAKIQNVSAASRLLGRGSAGGAGDTEEISLGSNLSMSGTTLNATGGASLTVEQNGGTPSVANVDTIIIDNGSVTDDGGGQVTINVGGGTITVEEDGETPVTGVGYIVFDGATVVDDGGGQVTVEITGGGGGNRPYFLFKAAQLEPMAILPLRSGAFTENLVAGTPLILIASFNTKLGATGRMEGRNPSNQLILNTSLDLIGLGSDSVAILVDPTLPTYSNAEDTYYDRLNTLATDADYAQRVVALSGEQFVTFLPGPYGSIILQVTEFDYTWIVARPYGTTLGWNLWDEIDDVAEQRVGNAFPIAVAKWSIANIQSNQDDETGSGAIVYAICQADWGEVTDPTTYDFRDDFMEAALDTGVWDIVESAANNVEIDSQFQWVKLIGNDTWGDNGFKKDTGFSRAQDLSVIFDVSIDAAASIGSNAPNLLVGWGDGTGVDQTDFAHGVQFSSDSGNGTLFVKEDGNTSRGIVGSGYIAGAIYRLRLTIEAATNECKYEIQGGGYAALGGNTWTDITPGTTSSAVGTLYPAFAIKGGSPLITCWVGDVKVTS